MEKYSGLPFRMSYEETERVEVTDLNVLLVCVAVLQFYTPAAQIVNNLARTHHVSHAQVRNSKAIAFPSATRHYLSRHLAPAGSSLHFLQNPPCGTLPGRIPGSVAGSWGPTV